MSIIVEFKTVRSAMSSLGITRDFADNGFSFESQDFDVEPGENLDFKFKNSESNLYASASGAIVWKKRNSEFGYLIGINFDGIDDETRRKMYEAVSATGHVPLNFFVSDDGYGHHNDEEPDLEDYESLYYDAADTYEAVNDTTVADEGISQQGASTQVKQLPLKLKTDENGDSSMEQDHEPFVNTFPVKIDRRKKKPFYEPVLKIIILILLVLAAILIYGEKGDVSDHSAALIKKEPVIVKEPEREEPVQTVTYAVPPAADVDQPKAPYIVQVGAWRNREYLNEMLPRIQELYPDAYVVVENNFNIIKIPGIMNREQGWVILEEIEHRFRLTALLMNAK